MTVQRNLHRITFYAQRYAMKHGGSIGKCQMNDLLPDVASPGGRLSSRPQRPNSHSIFSQVENPAVRLLGRQHLATPGRPLVNHAGGQVGILQRSSEVPMVH